MGLGPESPPPIVLSQSNSDYIIGGLPVNIPIPSRLPDSLSTTTVWQSTWYLVITRGSAKSGATGEASGRQRMLCILEPIDSRA